MNSRHHIAFVCPRFPEGPTVGGAETLLKQQAVHLARNGLDVTFLTTCARDHFTWENKVPPGKRDIDGLHVHFFPVDENRDIDTFLGVQAAICKGRPVSTEEESLWLDNNVNSRALYQHLRNEGGRYDAILTGPYLFGLVYHAAAIHPDKTLLVPCLHDEPFAYLKLIGNMFQSVRGCLFNSAPERDLARRIYDLADSRMHVVGMGIDPFESDPGIAAARHGIPAPYLLYCGRREPLKGTPLLIDYFSAFRARTGKDIRLLLTGAGPIELSSAIAPYVMDLGFVSEREKHDLMAGALAFCHPSVNESLGIVILESWLAGTPVIVHAGSAVLQHHCRNSNGGLWFRTYPEFEESLLLLLDNRKLHDAMGAAGREYVRRDYCWQRVGRKLMDALGIRGIPRENIDSTLN